MEQKPKLKPCPFCGKTEFLSVDNKQTFYEFQGEYGEAVIMIRCTKCDLDMWEHSHHIHSYEKRLGLIAEKWNKRVGDETD